MRDLQAILGALHLMASRSGLNALVHGGRRVVGVVMVKIRLDVLRMIHVAVVAFAVVFPYHLPVCSNLVINNLCHLRLTHPLRAHDLGHRLARSGEIRRRVREANKKHPLQILQMRGQQAKFIAIDFMHAPASDKRAVAFVCPLMIRANQPPSLAAVLPANERAAMPTDIVQRTNNTVIAANDEQWIGTDGDGKKIANLLHLAGVSNKYPLPLENAFHIGIMHLGFSVKLARH